MSRVKSTAYLLRKQYVITALFYFVSLPIHTLSHRSVSYSYSSAYYEYHEQQFLRIYGGKYSYRIAGIYDKAEIYKYGNIVFQFIIKDSI